MLLAVSWKDAAFRKCVATLLLYTRYVPHITKTGIFRNLITFMYNNLKDNVVIRMPGILLWGWAYNSRL